MTKSNKRHPTAKPKNSQRAKRNANHRIRKTDDVPNGNAFKRMFPSWDICDYRFYSTKEQFIKNGLYYAKLQYPDKSEEELISMLNEQYERYYIRK